MKKNVYFFGGKKADGNKKMKKLLGGKGANLAEMVNIGIPVPPGFTITTEICKYFNEHDFQYPEDLKEDVDENIKKLEDELGMKYGSYDKPLLLSVRSGAAISMPGMMDTILNLGLNDAIVDKFTQDNNKARFIWDAYRRLIQMFSNVAYQIDGQLFEDIISRIKKVKKISTDLELTVDDLKMIVSEYKKIFKSQIKKEFPQDPQEQLWTAIDAVFKSWNNKRARDYRKINNITELLGTAVNVQAMVFGNMGDDCATGVAFTRDPSTGEDVFFGEFLVNAQGEDVVAGIRTPQEITKESSLQWAKNNNIEESIRKDNFPSLEEIMPDVYQNLYGIQKKLEKHYKDMQDIEFTIQNGILYILQTRTGKRTAQAAVKIAHDMVKEKLIDKKTALLRINSEQLDQTLHPSFSPEEKEKAHKKDKYIAKGLPASPGAATGKVVFSADKAVAAKEEKQSTILVRVETSPEDIAGMEAAKGVLTQRGGMTSHAAVVARGMGKCCVAGCGSINISYKDKKFSGDEKTIKEGDYVSLDGSSGEIFKGKIKTTPPTLSNEFRELMSWADDRSRLEVHTNADSPKDAKIAREFGAKGIGLCRTEHMFFDKDRIDYVRGLILAETSQEREYPLSKLKEMQTKDFKGILEVMQDYSVTIRLLDPPLHEFLPKLEDENDIKNLSKKFNISIGNVKNKIDKLIEFNPMLGHRGCRLGITFPDIYIMQVEAIIEAACELTKKGINVKPEIMIPLVSTEKEFSVIEEYTRDTAKKIINEYNCDLKYKVGTMIEIPRACLVAAKIAKKAEFFSFGTNDLTQMGFGFSRDDSGKFLEDYVNKNILSQDPFQVLDQEGIGQLVEIAVKKGRKANPDLVIGICGEHGGEPKSIEFFHKIGLDYVSCSPYRVPIARLAAAQTVINES